MATDVAPDPTVGPTTHRLRDLDRRGRIVAALAGLLLLVPIASSLLRAVDDGWVASNDEAMIVLRARDVISGDPPLVGQPSTAGIYAEDHPARHPGPIEFYLLAVPVRALGPTWGTLLTIAVVTGASVLLTVWAAFRRAGPAVGLGAVVLVAAVTWSTGTAVLTDPISSNVGGYPLLAGAALAWALWAGDRRLWPVAVAVWSFTAQQHLAILGPAGVVVLWGLAAAAVTTGRARAWWESWRWALAAAVVGFVCWLPPLLDQAFGDGNLGAILGFSREGERGSVGLGAGVRAAGRALQAPPLFLRRDFDGGDLLDPYGTGTVVGVVAGVAVALTVAALAVRSRHRDRLTLVATGLLLAVTGVITTANVPDSSEQLRINFYRWTWPVAVAVWGAATWAVVEVVRPWVRARRADRGAAPAWLGVAAPAVVLAVVAVVVGFAATGDGVSDRRRDDLVFAFEAEAADAVLATIDRNRSVHVVTRGQAAFLAVTPALVLALEDAGVDVRLEATAADTVDEAQRAGYGPHRLDLGDDPGALVHVVTGRDPLPDVPGEVVATADLAADVDRLVAEVLAPVAGEEFVPAADAEAVRAGFGPEFEEFLAFAVPLFATDPAQALRGGFGVDLVRAGYFASPTLDPDLLAELRRAQERGTEVWGDEDLKVVVQLLD